MANQKISARTALTSTGLISVPVVRAGSTTNYRLVHNLSATSDPGVGDDDADGFSAGSLWFRSDTGVVFVCRSAATGAAVWIRLSAAKTTYIADNWIIPQEGVATASTNTHAINTIYFSPIDIEERCTIESMGATIYANQAAQNFQLALYANNPTTGRPTGAALGSTGNMSTATNTTVTADLSAPVQVERGRYWGAAIKDHATPKWVSFAQSGIGAAARYHGDATATNLLGAGVTLTGWLLAHTFGTWPDVTASSLTAINALSLAPVILVKPSSIP